MPQVRRSLTAEALRDRPAALASAFVVPLLRHAARPSCGVLWDAALQETRRRLQLLQGGELAGRTIIVCMKDLSLAHDSGRLHLHLG